MTKIPPAPFYNTFFTCLIFSNLTAVDNLSCDNELTAV